MSDRWLEFTVLAPAGMVEAAADILGRRTKGGVSIEEPFTALEDGAIERHLDKPVQLAAYLPEDEGSVAIRRVLFDELTSLLGPTAQITTQLRDQEEWAEAWKQFFHVERFGRIVIRPSWRPYTAQPDDVVVNLDPGMAFGTGQHPTTRMALELLDQRMRLGDRVLDVGTGSGILAIAAAKLGAAEVLAVDIEAQAVRVAQDNVADNGLTDHVRVAFGSLGNRWPFPDPPEDRFDLVLANTSAATAIMLGRELVGSLAPEGLLAAGGIIRSREEAAREAINEAGGTITETLRNGDWCTLLVVRNDG